MLRPWRLFFLATIIALAVGMPAMAQERLDIGIITVKQKDLADQLRTEILQGADFSSLAKAHSVGPTADRGGRLGRVPVKRLRSEYREAVKGLKPGVPSNVVPTEEGYSILYIFPVKVAPLPQPSPQVPTPSPTTPQTGELDVMEPPHVKSGRLVSEALESLAVGELDAADKAIDKALKLYGADELAKLFKKTILLAKESPKATEALKSTAMAMISLQGGEFDDAKKYFDEALTHQATFWPAILLKANLYANLQQLKEAKELLAKVLQLNPNSVMALESLGIFARDLDNADTARSYLKKAIALDPKSPKALYHLGAIELEAQKLDEAEKLFRASLDEDPYMFLAANDLGLVLAQKGRFADAEKSYRAAIKANGTFAPAHMNLGVLFGRQKQFNRAITEFNKALELDPNLRKAHFNLSLAYFLLNQYSLAIMHADKAADMNLDIPEWYQKKLAPHR
jgi:tetratricopeptide (TPR) repeat protein